MARHWLTGSSFQHLWLNVRNPNLSSYGEVEGIGQLEEWDSQDIFSAVCPTHVRKIYIRAISMPIILVVVTDWCKQVSTVSLLYTSSPNDRLDT